eukprot:45708_1
MEYNDEKEESKQNLIDFKIICQHLVNIKDLAVKEEQIRDTFSAFHNDKNKFIHDIIEALYSDEKQLPSSNKIAVKHLPKESEIRKAIYENILYKYINKEELDNTNFIQLAKVIIHKFHFNINFDEFVNIASNNSFHIDGKIFVKGTNAFRTSTNFSKLFKDITDYKRKEVAHIYTQTNTWKLIQSKTKPTTEDENKTTEVENEKTVSINVKEEKDEMKNSNDINNDDIGSDVYAWGVKYFYWNSHRYHKHYIDANHADLKDELINNTRLKFDFKKWQSLQYECDNLLKAEYVKQIQSNGYHQHVYKIQPNEPLTRHHIMSLKLYTDYSDLCNVICSTLRQGNELKIAEIAQCCKYLTEIIQCYGSLLANSKIQRYYRGVKKAFKFEALIMCFNLPTSTTNNYTIAATRFSGQGAGLVLELRNYKNSYSVYKFFCDSFSEFDVKETLFFGGRTVLKIVSITQVVKMHWKRYKKWIEPMNSMIRLVNGGTVKTLSIASNQKQQERMMKFGYHILSQISSAVLDQNLPKYIFELLLYHISSPVILNYQELLHEYKWMNIIFIKKPPENTGMGRMAVETTRGTKKIGNAKQKIN